MNEPQNQELITSGLDGIAQTIQADPTGTALFALGFFLGLFLFVRGIVQTFRRNWIAALLLIVLLFPLYLIWAFVEAFRSKPAPKVYNVHVQNTNA